MTSRASVSKLLIAIVMITGLVGCANKNQHITNLPPAVTETEVKNWYAAVGGLSQVADVTSASTKLVVQLHDTRIFEGDGYEATIRALGRIAQGGISAKQFLDTVPETFGTGTKNTLLSFADSALNELIVAEREGLAGVKNPNSQKELTAFYGSIRSALLTIKLLSQIQAVTPAPPAPAPAPQPPTQSTTPQGPKEMN